MILFCCVFLGIFLLLLLCVYFLFHLEDLKLMEYWQYLYIGVLNLAEMAFIFQEQTSGCCALHQYLERHW